MKPFSALLQISPGPLISNILVILGAIVAIVFSYRSDKEIALLKSRLDAQAELARHTARQLATEQERAARERQEHQRKERESQDRLRQLERANRRIFGNNITH